MLALLKRLFRRREPRPPFKCTHVGPTGEPDRLCQMYGCPDDPNWTGDGCR